MPAIRTRLVYARNGARVFTRGAQFPRQPRRQIVAIAPLARGHLMREIEVLAIQKRLRLPAHTFADRFGEWRNLASNDRLLVRKRCSFERRFERFGCNQTIGNRETNTHDFSCVKTIATAHSSTHRATAPRAVD